MKQLCLAALVAATRIAYAGADRFVEPSLEHGFNEMYNLAFSEAHRCFQSWEREHPDDPRGPVFDAAAYLFAEFDRLRILQSQFLIDDRSFLRTTPLAADPAIKTAFARALERTKSLSEARLQQNPHDEIALFATVLRYGLQADYDSLIAKQNIRALKGTKEGTRVAEQLLSLYPDCYDAYLASGVENYLLSQKSAPIRWLLNVAGAGTDKERGITRLRITAQKGVYLQPYAKLLLAIAALRDSNTGEAERLLADLATRFPRNRLYRDELAKVKSRR